MDSPTSLATPAKLSTFNAGSRTRALLPSEPYWKDPAPVALTTSDGGGDSPAARAPSPAPPQLPLRKLASPPPRAHTRALTLASARQAGALGRRTERLQRPRVPLTGPTWASRLRSPPPHALPRPRSRRAAPTARAQGPALTREGRWRRRSSTYAARRAEAGTRAPQQQPRQPPFCQHRSGRHRPPAPPGGGRGRGLLLKGPRREPNRAGPGLAGWRTLPQVSHAVLS